MEKAMRLDKYLADMGKGTRTQIKDAVRKGRVRINEVIVTKPEQKVFIPQDQVLWDGQPVSYISMEYYMLNKPQGVVSATEDRRFRTVLDLIADKSRKDLFPVGRLDLDTEGLLLITNDGDLAHRLLSPRNHVDKTYFARCEGTLSGEWVSRFAEGIILPDGLECLPAGLEILNAYENITEIRLTIREGKFHQVKRMMDAAGCPVQFLKRLSMGPLWLDETLKPGEFRVLTGEEQELLNRI